MSDDAGANGLATGMLEILDDRSGGGFLRSAKQNYAIQPGDPKVSAKLISDFFLRGGEMLVGPTKPGGGGEGRPKQSKQNNRNKKNNRRHGGQQRQQENTNSGGGLILADIESINGMSPGEYSELKRFEDLTVIDPLRAMRFEMTGGSISMRIVDLLCPIGFGQRGLIVAPPRTGKTVLLQQMAAGIAKNYPDLYMMVLLIDERPEEVTDMRRTVHGEVVASSNDHDIASHVRVARMMIERAKRKVEAGEDVLILLDSLTRLGRAFNAYTRGSGRTMSGGIDIRALTEPKTIFGAARNIEDGGSLTIIASCLIETGSRMDEVIFNEFKGTGNMEIILSREMANRRVWPAINLQQSGTRKEELLLSEDALRRATHIRRSLNGRSPDREMEMIIAAMNKYPTNAEFVADMPK